MKISHFEVILAMVLAAIVFTIPVAAQQPPGKAQGPAGPDESGRIFDIKVPKGFEQEPQEEAGIIKWKKNSAEIYLVVGDLFLESGQGLFEELFKAATANKDFENVQKLSIKGGHGLMYTDKSPGDPGRLRSLHVTIITDKKVIQIDFTAPDKDFASLASEFEAARKSFKLKNANP
ncbi:MAG: hypothetical protein LDL33_01225 [Desulfomonile sp.]|nr:hypothetical protein [Desulfomonile sp.]